MEIERIRLTGFSFEVTRDNKIRLGWNWGRRINEAAVFLMSALEKLSEQECINILKRRDDVEGVTCWRFPQMSNESHKDCTVESPDSVGTDAVIIMLVRGNTGDWMLCENAEIPDRFQYGSRSVMYQVEYKDTDVMRGRDKIRYRMAVMTITADIEVPRDTIGYRLENGRLIHRINSALSPAQSLRLPPILTPNNTDILLCKCSEADSLQFQLVKL